MNSRFDQMGTQLLGLPERFLEYIINAPKEYRSRLIENRMLSRRVELKDETRRCRTERKAERIASLQARLNYNPGVVTEDLETNMRAIWSAKRKEHDRVHFIVGERCAFHQRPRQGDEPWVGDQLHSRQIGRNDRQWLPSHDGWSSILTHRLEFLLCRPPPTARR